MSGATRYQVYISEESGKQTLLVDTAATTYRDDGTIQANLFIEVPQDNTTTAPKFSELSLIDGRIWGTKDPNNKYRVYWGGDELNTSAFSAYSRNESMNFESALNR